MKIHEFQAKQLLAQYGVPVAAGVPCDDPEQVRQAFAEIAHGRVVGRYQDGSEDQPGYLPADEGGSNLLAARGIMMASAETTATTATDETTDPS